MTFEKKFPSFREGYDNSKLMISRIAVKAHCLDKQRVKEAIKKVEDKYYKYGVPDSVEPCEVIYEIEKELGLED